MAKRRRREIPVGSVCFIIHLLLLYHGTKDSTRQDFTYITLGGITDTEG
jgi:hypothetical protein